VKWFNFLKKAIFRLFLLSIEIIKEYQYFLFQKKQDSAFEKKDNEDTRFININRTYWAEQEPSEKKGIILIEGFFAQSGNNYLLRTGMVAKAIQEKTKLTPTVIFDKAAFKLISAKKKYHSFGINRFIYIKPSIKQGILFLYSTIVALKFYLRLKDIKDILALNYNGILFGDLIYDDILKFNKNRYTISTKDFVMLKVISRAFYYYFSYARVFKREKINYLVSTHTMYVQYGMLVRVALRYGADVMATSDLMVNHLRSREWKNNIISATWHDMIKEATEEALMRNSDKSMFIDFAQSDLNKRLDGKSEQFDARLAYKNKMSLDKESLKKKLNIDLTDARPFVIIFAHIFTDAPHSSSFLLFHDYYEWLKETLSAISQIKEVNWIIKPHPSVHLYNEEGLIEDLLSKVVDNTLSTNIFLFPQDVSTNNLDELVQAVITVNGTAGIEFSCLGLPVIVGGRPFYSGKGFTLDPPTKEAYFSLLKTAHTIPKLKPYQIINAKAYYGAYMQLGKPGEIITADALDTIWGYIEQEKANIELGNKKINDNLKNKNPKEEQQYKKVKEYVESAFI